MLLEALAAGTIPIAADNPGYAHVLGERAAELLFPAGNATRLADRIREITRDRARRDSLRGWGERFHRRFLWDRVAERVEKAYERAIRL